MNLSDYININVKIMPPMYNYCYLLYDIHNYSLPKDYQLVKLPVPMNVKFLESNNLPGKLSWTGPYGCDFLLEFVEHLPVNVCEDVYRTVAHYKPIGCVLVTNRSDLFTKEKEVYEEISKLEKKKNKLEKKLNKVSDQIDEIKSYFKEV